MSKDKIKVNMNVYDIPIVIEELEKAEDTIRKLQKENQQLKKQKDDVVEYIKTFKDDIRGLDEVVLLRMLGEIDENR